MSEGRRSPLWVSSCGMRGTRETRRAGTSLGSAVERGRRRPRVDYAYDYEGRLLDDYRWRSDRYPQSRS